MVQVSGSLANKGPAACQDPRKYPEELDRDRNAVGGQGRPAYEEQMALVGRQEVRRCLDEVVIVD